MCGIFAHTAELVNEKHLNCCRVISSNVVLFSFYSPNPVCNSMFRTYSNFVGFSHQFISELLLQLVKLGEVPDGRASQGGRVLDQNHLSLQRLELELKRKLI